MSRTLTSPRRQVWSRTCRSSLPSASEATSLGRRNPRKKNRGAFMRGHFAVVSKLLSTLMNSIAGPRVVPCDLAFALTCMCKFRLTRPGTACRLPSVNVNHYKTALEAARQELAELEDERAKI